MTLYGTGTSGIAGQQISPFQGTNAGVPAGRALVDLPIVGDNVTLLAAVSTGATPLNALVNTVNGVGVGGNPAVSGSDPATINQLISNGNGSTTARGPSTTLGGTTNNQQFVDGTSASAQLSNGPTDTATSSLVEAPVAGSTITSNVAVFANLYGG